MTIKIMKHTLIAYLIAILIFAPFFLHVGPDGVKLGDSIYSPSPSGQTLPISSFFIAILSMITVLKILVKGKIQTKRSIILYPMMAFFVINTSALLYGFFIHPAPINILFYFQTFIPLIAFFIGLNYIKTIEDVRNVLLLFVTIIGITVFLLFIQSFIDQGVVRTLNYRMVDYIWIFNIYQIANYFPLVVVTALIMALSIRILRIHYRINSLNKFLLIFIIILFISVFLFLARGAILTMFVAIAVTFLLLLKSKQYKLLKVFPIFLILMVLFTLLATFASPISIKKMEFALYNAFEDRSVYGRIDAWQNALKNMRDNPVFGLAYTTQGGEEREFKRIGNPHNMYLQVGIRAGFWAMALYILMLLIAARNSYTLYRETDVPEFKSLGSGMFGILVGFIIISNNLRDSFIQPYTGIILWFLIGVVEASWHIYLRGQYNESTKANHS